jgi:hypothetical protein
MASVVVSQSPSNNAKGLLRAQKEPRKGREQKGVWCFGPPPPPHDEKQCFLLRRQQ